MTPTRRLLVVGAGPKAAAIAAKATTLRRLGIADVAVTAVDRSGVAAHWDGHNGFTTGGQLLGTPPEKDVGFPYASLFGPVCAEDMLRTSWMAFKAAHGGYSDWVDRGKRHPDHREWAAYLRWVFSRTDARVVVGEVETIKGDDAGGLQAHVCDASTGERAWHAFDGAVFTGPGEPNPPPVETAGEHLAHVFDGKSYWQVADLFTGLADADVAVVGGGETAASVIVDLVGRVRPTTNVLAITRHPVLYSRGEGYQENQLYSRPERWEGLPEENKREFIRRTDRGVISLHAVERIRHVDNVLTDHRTVRRLRRSPQGVVVTLESSGSKKTQDREFRFVVFATGFDPFKPVQDALRHDGRLDPFPSGTNGRDHARAEIQRGVDFHLRLALPHAAEPRAYNVHAPMLAGFTQGPGFPNLSCLGILSDRVLSAYVDPDLWAANVPAGVH